MRSRYSAYALAQGRGAAPRANGSFPRAGRTGAAVLFFVRLRVPAIRVL